MTIRVICPDCGPQEHRGYVNPFHAPLNGNVSRHVDRKNDTCPKCCSETLPNAASTTVLAAIVNAAATELFEKEDVAILRRERNTLLKKSRRARIKRNGMRIVAG